MIQGGGFTDDLVQKTVNAAIKNEANNGLGNEIGSIAMARTSDPHSATAQFFINVAANSFLDFSEQNQAGWGYAVFGKVIAGMDVVTKISVVETGSKGTFPTDAPVADVTITKAIVVD